MSTDAESHDDVAGLFKRLGRRADNRQYHEFSPPAITPATAAPAATDAPAQPAVPPPLTEVPTQAESATEAEAWSGTPAPAPAQPAGPAPQGSLAALFERLANAPLPASAQSPLAHLRER